MYHLIFKKEEAAWKRSLKEGKKFPKKIDPDVCNRFEMTFGYVTRPILTPENDYALPIENYKLTKKEEAEKIIYPY
jgi:hypothetical protein